MCSTLKVETQRSSPLEGVAGVGRLGLDMTFSISGLQDSCAE